ncbi:hypothetical protein PRIPAC_96583 [Pristionchus pacificus]|uniref:RNA helicase n=1 Tax=Pristionchus pacificus TaxID=54126 RepID=A0A2A6BD81_PRIPA|nr:hypothetical protein PRIPAC_96583 [Pristionchus pacificus]|eukprot:PDM63829.1 hypothetical protein PRIPAC_49802 [Pristionchus pacificus]
MNTGKNKRWTIDSGWKGKGEGGSHRGVVTVQYQLNTSCKFLSAVPASDEAIQTLFHFVFEESKVQEDIHPMKIEKVQGPTMKIIRQRAQVEKMDLTAELPKLKTVLELIQLGISGLMREELKLLDLAPRVITLQFLTKTLRNRGIFRSEIIGKVKEDGWSEGEMLTVLSNNGTFGATILISRFAEDNQIIEIVVDLEDGDLPEGEVTATLVEPSPNPSHVCVQRGVVIKGRGEEILKTIYDCVNEQPEIAHRQARDIANVAGVEWDPEQGEFIILSSSLRNSLVFLDAGPGCGKTTVLGESVHQTVINNPDVLVLVLAITNTAVGVATEKIQQPANRSSSNTRAIRVIFRHDEESTETDLSNVILRSTDGQLRKSVRNLRELMKSMNNANRDESTKVRFSSQILQFKDMEGAFRCITKNSLERVIKVERPNVLCMTIDTLLKAMKDDEMKPVFGKPKKNALTEYIKSKKEIVIFVDEASQVPEASLLALTDALPQACQRYCGDPRQLPPFSCLNEPSFYTDFGAYSVAKVLKRSRKVLRVTLRNCRRMDPGVGAIPSSLFYGGSLLFTRERSRGLLPELFKGNEPVLFVELEGQAEEVSASGSRFNLEELEIVDRLTNRMKNELHEYSLRVITFYKEQKDRMKMKNPSLTVGTVDASQGSEADIVILMTTRTSGEPEFVSQNCRLNVALTRAKKALIIIGRQQTLIQHESWKKFASISPSYSFVSLSHPIVCHPSSCRFHFIDCSIITNRIIC